MVLISTLTWKADFGYQKENITCIHANIVQELLLNVIQSYLFFSWFSPRERFFADMVPRGRIPKERTMRNAYLNSPCIFLSPSLVRKDKDMGGCQNYGPFLDPYYSTAPNT